MKKIFLFIVLGFVYMVNLNALSVTIDNVEINENNLLLKFEVTNLMNSEYYLTNINHPYYKVINDTLFVFFNQIAIPDNVCVDYPEIIGDEIIFRPKSFEMNIKFTENNYFPYGNYNFKVVVSEIKKIIFSFGYINMNDFKFAFDTKVDIDVQRDKFYFIIDNQKIINIEYVLPVVK